MPSSVQVLVQALLSGIILGVLNRIKWVPVIKISWPHSKQELYLLFYLSRVICILNAESLIRYTL